MLSYGFPLFPETKLVAKESRVWNSTHNNHSNSRQDQLCCEPALRGEIVGESQAQPQTDHGNQVSKQEEILHQLEWRAGDTLVALTDTLVVVVHACLRSSKWKNEERDRTAWKLVPSV